MSATLRRITRVETAKILGFKFELEDEISPPSAEGRDPREARKATPARSSYFGIIAR
jgi:hypothetical protein